MFKRLILPALLAMLTVVTSCSKSNDPEPEPTPRTIKFEASSTGRFDVSISAKGSGSGYIIADASTGLTAYSYEYTNLHSGNMVSASLTGATGADIPASLKIDGVNITPNVDKKDDKGRTVKSWDFTIK